MRTLQIAAQVGAGLLVVSLAVSARAAVTPAAPNYTFPDGSRGFAFVTTGGRLNPEVLVDFNPQPDPPGFSGSVDTTPGGGRITQIATPLSDTGYGFLIALLGIGPDAMEPLPPAPNSDGDTGLTFPGDFRLALNFAGPGNAVDWVAFNPQPDPPGDWFGAQFAYAATGDPMVTFTLSEGERPLSLTLASVPEPASWALMLVGVAGLGGLARVQRQGEGRITKAA